MSANAISYVPPIADIRFAMEHLAGLDEVAALPGWEEVTPDLVDSILDEAGKFAAGVLAPLNAVGDREGVRWSAAGVTTPAGFKEAYRQFVAAGWNNMAVASELGGQGLPSLVGTAVLEMVTAANKSFSMCSGLTAGAIEALSIAGSDEVKARYLPPMVSGAWSGTMNLTEPQAGSDVGAVRCRAVPQVDGSYRLHGQKIFITFGEHDLTENIVHLVLARIPDAPEGVRGISLFVVPKFLVNDDGSLGARNDVHCVSIEHKLGIHASPTCTMAYGDGVGAVGHLVGEPNKGLQTMFVMMNAARLNVGMEGVALSERAYRLALSYAKDRVQSKPLKGGTEAVTIIHHPDVRRMLMLMKSQTEAMRALALVIAAAQDKSRRHPDATVRAEMQTFIDLMIPVFKGWATETGIEVTSLGIQVHGGMGYIEETGATQFLRDLRISTIYEGTTAIQANDLLGRKIVRDNGAALGVIIARMRIVLAKLECISDDIPGLHQHFTAALDGLELASCHVLGNYAKDIDAVSVGAVPFLLALGKTAGGWQLIRAALVARRLLAKGNGQQGFLEAKVITAQFYAEHVLSQVPGLIQAAITGGRPALDIAVEQL